MIRRLPGGTAQAAATRVLLNSAAVMGGAWLTILLLAMSTPGAGLRSVPVGWVTWACLAAAWVASLVLRAVPAWVVVAVANATAVVCAANTDPAAWLTVGRVVIEWFVLASVLSALLLGTRAAAAVIISAGASVLAGMLGAGLVEPPADPQVWRGPFVITALGVVVGFVVSGIVRALRDVAQGADDAAAMSELARLQERGDAARRDEIARLGVVIHDGAINTLGAIARGAGRRDPERAMSRCREDLGRLRHVLGDDIVEAHARPPAFGAVEEIVAVAQRRGDLLGLRIVVDAAGSCEVPPDVRWTLCSAVEEALTNISKHSGVHEARMSVRGAPGWIRIEVRDSGRGYPAAAGDRPGSLAARCARVGIGIVVECPPEGGTVVRLGWEESAQDLPDGDSLETAGALWVTARARMVTWFSVWFVGFFAFQTAMSVGIAPLGGNLVALAVFAGVAALAVSTARAWGSLRGIGAGYVALAAGIVTYSSAAGTPGCTRIEIASWGALGGTICLVTLVFMSSGRWVWAGICAYLAGLGLVVGEIFATSAQAVAVECATSALPTVLIAQLAVVLVAYLFRELAVRNWRKALILRDEAWTARERAVRARAREQARRLQVEASIRTTIPLLDDMATGRADPASPETARACAREELYLRSLAAIAPDLGPLGDALMEIIRLGHSRGVSVSVESGEAVDRPDGAALGDLGRTLGGLVRAMVSGSEATVTMFPREGGAALTFMCEREAIEFSDPPWAGALSACRLRVTDESDADELLVEFAWATAPVRG